MPDNGSFRSYADLGRPYVLWNVFAAPEFSIEPVTSCFPIAGCVSYRGYFGEADAQAAGAALRQRGYDVFVGGVPAYSTLGWFDDPVLSTFIQYPEAELARLIFHELAHQLLYVKDDTRFNESFAVTVEQAGVERWLAQNGDERERAAYARLQGMQRDFVALLGQVSDDPGGSITGGICRRSKCAWARRGASPKWTRSTGSSRPHGAGSPATTAGSPASPTTRCLLRSRSTPNWCRHSAHCCAPKAATAAFLCRGERLANC